MSKLYLMSYLYLNPYSTREKSIILDIRFAFIQALGGKNLGS
jgi:hypothetical protein